jgi:glycosyltransferase involved in cell wall biosynthesis
MPMHNEEEAVKPALTMIQQQLDALKLSFELICIDDGSRDQTAAHLLEYASQDPRFQVVSLSRNFGKEAAMAAGLEAARGKAVLLMDADLQHPPELLPEMVARWREGYDVVNGVKAARGTESRLYRPFASFFNWLMGESAGTDFAGASDFKLLDRQVVDAVVALPEKTRFFRGLVAWVGFRTVNIPFVVQDRVAGESKWGVLDLVRYSIRNLLAFSALPLKLIATIGGISLIFTAMLTIWTIYRYLRGDALSGFPTVILLQLGIGSLLLASMGTISLYLYAMFKEMKQRPTYVVAIRRRDDETGPDANTTSSKD